MKKLLFVCAGLISLCSLGQATAKADDWGYHRDGDDDRPRRPVYHESRDRCDDDRRDYYRPQRRVVVREYYTPSYYRDDCQPRYYHRRHHSHVGFFLPLPPLPF